MLFVIFSHLFSHDSAFLRHVLRSSAILTFKKDGLPVNHKMKKKILLRSFSKKHFLFFTDILFS